MLTAVKDDHKLIPLDVYEEGAVMASSPSRAG